MRFEIELLPSSCHRGISGSRSEFGEFATATGALLCGPKSVLFMKPW